MPGMGPDEIRRRVASLEWYHTIDLGNGILTPGHYDHRPYLRYYGLPADLSGKTALDIGAASGFFSFDLERRGARVTAVDLPQWMDHDFGPAYRPDKTPEEGLSYLREPFDLARSVLGSSVRKLELTVYDLSPETVGVHDFVFCGSLLLHVTDPVRGLAAIRTVTGEVAVIATALYQDGRSEKLALFAGHHRGDVWWLPNRACLEAMLESAGFATHEWVSEFRLDYRDGRTGFHHGVVRAFPEPHGPAAESEPSSLPSEPEQASAAEDALAQRDAEIARLRSLVEGYERGRFIRLMRWIGKLRRR